MSKITATDFYNYLQCKYRVYLDRFGDEKIKDRVSAFVKLLWERGIQHEDDVIASVIKNRGKTFVEIKKDKPAGEETFRETLELMKKGVDYIYQGVLIDNDFAGRPDLLEKVAGKSKFGNYHYIPVDIKAGRGYEGSDHEDLKESYLFQLNFYGLLLGKIQGVIPEIGKIINIDKEEISYKLELANEKFNKILSDVSKINRGEELYQPIIGGKCGLCEWQSYCGKWAEDRDDLSLIFRVGEIKYKLQEYGVKTISDLLKKPLDNWLSELPTIKEKGFFKGIAEKSLTSLYNKAVIRRGGKEKINPAIKLSNSKMEVHFDIEDDPTQSIIYLYGFWIIDNGKRSYKYIFAKNVDDEERAVREVWDFLNTLDGIPIYHYSQHEISTLKNLQEKYKLPQEPFDILKKNAIDLYKTITDYTDWPLTSYGLKSICKFIGFKWSSEDAGGANSIEWFSKFLKGDEEMLKKILQYNEEDCRATAYLKDYLGDSIK